MECPFRREEEERDHLDGHSELSTGASQRMQLEAQPSAFPNAEFEQLMARCPASGPWGRGGLVERLSPQLYRFFASQSAIERMPKICCRTRGCTSHTYRAGDPVLPWVYTIARRVR